MENPITKEDIFAPEFIELMEALDAFKPLDKDVLLKKAEELKGTDAEGWAIGNLIEKIVNEEV